MSKITQRRVNRVVHRACGLLGAAHGVLELSLIDEGVGCCSFMSGDATSEKPGNEEVIGKMLVDLKAEVFGVKPKGQQG